MRSHATRNASVTSPKHSDDGCTPLQHRRICLGDSNATRVVIQTFAIASRQSAPLHHAWCESPAQVSAPYRVPLTADVGTGVRSPLSAHSRLQVVFTVSRTSSMDPDATRPGPYSPSGTVSGSRGSGRDPPITPTSPLILGPPQPPKSGPKRSEFLRFFRSSGAKLRGGGGAPPTTLILLRNQCRSPAARHDRRHPPGASLRGLPGRLARRKIEKNSLFF